LENALITKYTTFGLIILVILILLTGCGSNTQGSVSAIETYINALGNKDVNQISSISCPNWEQNALTEVDSLAAVGTKIEDLACKEAGQDGNDTLVTCTGKIALDYGGEAQYIDLAGRTYISRQVAGDWRMCGYK
jgi:hypothetical protein